LIERALTKKVDDRLSRQNKTSPSRIETGIGPTAPQAAKRISALPAAGGARALPIHQILFQL
jgi:hypothetical protein